MSTAEQFGQWLKQRRRLLDLTQQDLAQAVGCSVASIRKYEAGERRPSRQIAERLATQLQIPRAQRDHFITLARPPCEEPSAKFNLEGSQHDHRLTSTLPPQSTPFVGREEELETLKNLFEDSTCRGQ